MANNVDEKKRERLQQAYSMYEMGYTIKGKTFYYKDKKADKQTQIDGAPIRTEMAEVCEIFSSPERKEEYVVKIYRHIKDSPFTTYNGAFYHIDKKTPISICEVRRYFAEEVKLDVADIEQIIRYYPDYKSISELPSFDLKQFDSVKAVEPKIKFCKAMYQLVYYLVHEQKQHNDKKFIFSLVSDANYGKSTFANFLMQLFDGESAMANLENWGRFDLAGVIHARLAIFNEVDAGRHGAISSLMQMSGGDTMAVDKKFQNQRDQQFGGFVVLIGNNYPYMRITSSGMQARWIDLPLEAPTGKLDKSALGHKWTKGEIKWVLDKAKEIGPMDYQAELNRTFKDILSRHSAFKHIFSTFEEYQADQTIENHFNYENFEKFKLAVDKFFTDPRELAIKWNSTQYKVSHYSNLDAAKNMKDQICEELRANGSI